MLTIQTKERISMIDEIVMKRKIRRDDKDCLRHYSFLLIYFGDMNCLIWFFKNHFRKVCSFIMKLNKKTLCRQSVDVYRGFVTPPSRNHYFHKLCNGNYRYMGRGNSLMSLVSVYFGEFAFRLSGGIGIWDI